MQKHITGLLIAAFLSGCAPSRQAGDDAFIQKEMTEEASWAALDERSAKECDAGLLPPGRERAVELSDCVTRLVKRYVLPNAVSPDLLLSSRAEALRIAQDYADGKMSPEEYKKRSEDRLKSYSDALSRDARQRTLSGIRDEIAIWLSQAADL